MLKYSVCIFLTIIAIAVAQTDDAKREERVFNQWLKKHNLDVAETDDLSKWKTEVIKKFKEAEAHNAKFRKGEVKFSKAINHFSHLTDEQRRAQLYGFEINPQKPTNAKFVPEVDPALLKDFPDYWNWVDHGAVFPVQDQKACGSCYIFGAIGAIEGHSCLYTNTCEKLSEQESLDCSEGKYCDKGNPETVYNYTQSASGATYEKGYKYTAKPAAQCDPSKRPRVPGTKVLDWKWMPNHAETIRYYLKTVGPMTISILAYPNLDNYQGGVYDEVGGGPPGGHLILLVGYGTDPDGTPYWIMKNSWSTTWGENGYVRMKRGVNLSNCESQWPGYPILEGT